MPALFVTLLDRFRATLEEGTQCSFRTRKVQALFIYLLVEEAFTGRPVVHQREALMALLWPDSPVRRAQGNLRQALFHLRRSLPATSVSPKQGAGCQPFMVTDRSTVGIDPALSYDLDVSAFLEQLRKVKAHNHINLVSCSSCQAQLEAAVSLYQDDFLPDFSLPECTPFEEWSLLTRERLKSQALEALHNLTAAQLERGDFEAAQRNASRQLSIDYLRETAYRQLMESLARRGLKCEALVQFQRCSKILARELHIPPSAETQALAEKIRAGALDPRDAPTAFAFRELSDVPPNFWEFLPHSAAPVVDREEELAQLSTLMSDSSVSITALVGLDGFGKTRLASAFAEKQVDKKECADLFPDCIVFIPLCALGPKNVVLHELGNTALPRLAVEGRYGQASSMELEYFLNQLRDKHSLLILDDFEEKELQTTLLVRILQAAPWAKIILTASTRPHVPGARFLPLKGLQFPDDLRQLPSSRSECLERFPAFALFRQCARLVQPDFNLNTSNLHHVGQICQAVGGMPLALEHVAQWLRVASPARIAFEIRRSLRLLEPLASSMYGTSRCVVAILREIWEQLNQSERIFLARLSRLERGFTRKDTISAIRRENDPGQTVPVLGRLVDKNVLQYDRDKDCYHIPELLRRYAVERMADSAIRSHLISTD